MHKSPQLAAYVLAVRLSMSLKAFSRLVKMPTATKSFAAFEEISVVNTSKMRGRTFVAHLFLSHGAP